MKTNEKKNNNKPTKENNIHKNRAFGLNKAYSSDHNKYMIQTQKEKKMKTHNSKKRFLLEWN